MSHTNSDDVQVFQQDLDNGERTIVDQLYTWLDTNTNARWKQTERFPGVEQCLEKELRDLAKPFQPKVRLSRADDAVHQR